MRRIGRIKARKSDGEALRQQYKDSLVSDRCELALYVNQAVDHLGRHEVYPGCEPPAAHVHEIWSVGGTRPLVWTNFIAISADPHDANHFGADVNSRELRMLFILAKVRKRILLKTPEEFNIAEANACCGKGGGILGWAEGLDPFTGCMAAYHFELVRRLEDLHAEDGL